MNVSTPSARILLGSSSDKLNQHCVCVGRLGDGYRHHLSLGIYRKLGHRVQRAVQLLIELRRDVPQTVLTGSIVSKTPPLSTKDSMGSTHETCNIQHACSPRWEQLRYMLLRRRDTLQKCRAPIAVL